MAETARKMGLNPPTDLCIRKITVAGEPGGSIPATRKRMEDAWGAKVYDQVGSTEIGHWGWECRQQAGLHVNEALYLIEIEDVNTGECIDRPGKRGKMVVTTFNRLAQPCIRFDVKDLIEWNPEPCACGRTFRLLLGGIKEAYRGRGVDALLGEAMIRSARAAGFTYFDSHHELENNARVQAEMARMNGEIYKRYRIFEKAL